jgi:hypothetical protein
MEHEAERPALTSIVTHKYGDKEPGSGFYEMARSLGYQSVLDEALERQVRERCFSSEFHRAALGRVGVDG